MQHLETVNAVITEQTSQDNLILNYVSRLQGLIQEKEQALATAQRANSMLQRHVAETQAQLNASLQEGVVDKEAMILRSMIANVGDAGSSSAGDVTMDMNCQMCHKKPSCVLILPCSHLCCCLACKHLVHICPVCATVKQSIVEVSWPQMKFQGADFGQE